MRFSSAAFGLSFLGFASAACGSGDAGDKAGGVTNAGSNGQSGSSNSGGANGGASVNGGLGGAAGTSSSGSSNGGSSSAGSAGTNAGGSAGQGGGGTAGPSGLPIPPGDANVPKPSGAAANLKVLPWAGFKAAVSYTFDDSQPSQFEHWAELKATGAPVTYFITTSANYIVDYDKVLKEVASTGGELGNHTVNHCNFNLTGCATPLATAQAEIDQCSEYLTKTLGQPESLTFAYPFGDTGYETDAKTRFFLARGIGGGLIAPGDATNPFNLPVVAAQGGENADFFSGHVDDAQGQGKWLIFLFHSLGPTANTWYATVDIASVTGSIEHAKSLSDVWIDTMANVGAYWLGEKLLQGTGPTWTWTLPTHFPTSKYLRVMVDGGTLKQGDQTLTWDPHGYYEVALDAGSLSWTP